MKMKPVHLAMLDPDLTRETLGTTPRSMRRALLGERWLQELLCAAQTGTALGQEGGVLTRAPDLAAAAGAACMLIQDASALLDASCAEAGALTFADGHAASAREVVAAWLTLARAYACRGEEVPAWLLEETEAAMARAAPEEQKRLKRAWRAAAREGLEPAA